MNSKYDIVLEIYEAPSVSCCTVLVENGYSSSKRGDIEDLGETKDEGYW
jgi:hypothetical protein